MPDFADRLKLYRTMYDLTLEELANRLHTQKQAVHRYETRQQVPKIDTVAEYARLMDVTVPWLIGYDDGSSDLRTQKKNELCDAVKDMSIQQISALIVIAESMKKGNENSSNSKVG